MLEVTPPVYYCPSYLRQVKVSALVLHTHNLKCIYSPILTMLHVLVDKLLMQRSWVLGSRGVRLSTGKVQSIVGRVWVSQILTMLHVLVDKLLMQRSWVLGSRGVRLSTGKEHCGPSVSESDLNYASCVGRLDTYDVAECWGAEGEAECRNNVGQAWVSNDKVTLHQCLYSLLSLEKLPSMQWIVCHVWRGTTQ